MNIKAFHLFIVTIVFFAVSYFTSSSIIELISAISGLLCVWLAAKESIWTYPIGMVNIAAFMYIFWGAGLYADFTLQIFFAILSIYGWIFWLTKRGNSNVRPTKKLTLNGWILFIPLIILGSYVWASVNIEIFDNPSIPYLDAFVATLSIAAQIMLSSKRLENWYLWIAVDILSIGMYWYKDLHLVSLLYVFFLINAVYGLISWRREYVRNAA